MIRSDDQQIQHDRKRAHEAGSHHASPPVLHETLSLRMRDGQPVWFRSNGDDAHFKLGTHITIVDASGTVAVVTEVPP